MSLLDVAPLLLPLESTNFFKKYSGFVNILGHPYRIYIEIPSGNAKKISELRFHCEWKLHHHLKNHVKLLLQQQLKNADSLASFLKNFVLTVEQSLKDSLIEPEIQTTFTQLLLTNIQELGWSKISNIGHNFSFVELAHTDQAERLHKLKVFFNQQDITVCPSCVTQLPEAFNFHWSGKSRLSHIFQEFEVAVNMFQHFWNMMQEIDDNCCVLEPELITLASSIRRIAITPDISIQIKVNCRQPSTFPECKFFGDYTATSNFRETLNVNLNCWDVERSLLKNLQEVLDIDFPSPTDTKIEEIKAECGICYCHHQNQEIPDIVCEDTKCSHTFHQSCLYEGDVGMYSVQRHTILCFCPGGHNIKSCMWLRNLNARQNSKALFGECPFCNHPIRVKIPTKSV